MQILERASLRSDLTIKYGTDKDDIRDSMIVSQEDYMDSMFAHDDPEDDLEETWINLKGKQSNFLEIDSMLA